MNSRRSWPGSSLLSVAEEIYRASILLVVLLVVWLPRLGTFHTLGELIHILLVVAIVAVPLP